MEYDVIIKVRSQKGECVAEHKVGDEMIYKGLKMKGYICPSAFNVLYRYIYALKFGAEFPWGKDGAIRIACPDAKNPVVFELRRKKAED